jgi:hypothetical protein
VREAAGPAEAEAEAGEAPAAVGAAGLDELGREREPQGGAAAGGVVAGRRWEMSVLQLERSRHAAHFRAHGRDYRRRLRWLVDTVAAGWGDDGKGDAAPDGTHSLLAGRL